MQFSLTLLALAALLSVNQLILLSDLRTLHYSTTVNKRYQTADSDLTT